MTANHTRHIKRAGARDRGNGTYWFVDLNTLCKQMANTSNISTCVVSALSIPQHGFRAIYLASKVRTRFYGRPPQLDAARVLFTHGFASNEHFLNAILDQYTLVPPAGLAGADRLYCIPYMDVWLSFKLIASFDWYALMARRLFHWLEILHNI